MARELETDVLIIGGGAAGAKTAIDASDLGMRVTMLVKGFVGKSGCSIFAGNLNYFAPPTDSSGQESEQERFNRILTFQAKYTHYLGDQEYMLRASKYTVTEFYPWLERLGLYVLRREDGSIVADLPRRTSLWAPKMGMSGTVIMDIMRKEIRRRPAIRVFEETACTSLLTNGGSVVGATGLDYRSGEFLVVRAKVVVLATGHSNYLSLRSTGTREGTGAGWVLAARVGAELQNLEMQWYHASDMAYPRAWMRLHLYPNPLPDTSHRTRLVNKDGEVFFDGNVMPDNPVPYIMQLKALCKQVLAGKASFLKDYYTSYRHIEPRVLPYIYQTQFLKKLGLDPTRDLVENAITWHMNVGGVRVSGKDMTTNVPGLLVAGSVGSLVTGGIANVMYDGTVAARTARELVSSIQLKPLNQKQVAEEEARVLGRLNLAGREGLLPAQVKKRIRTVMAEYMSYIKSETSMQRGLAELERIRHEVVPRMRLGDASRRFNYDWLESLDVDEMLDACELVIRFSLYRKESRGAFFREDYPVTDNVEWLTHVVGRLEDGELRIERRPVELPYVRPAEDRADFFAVDY